MTASKTNSGAPASRRLKPQEESGGPEQANPQSRLESGAPSSRTASQPFQATAGRARQVVEDAEESRAPFRQATLLLIGKAAFELAAGSEDKWDQVQKLIKLLLDAEHQEIERRKVAALETRASAAAGEAGLAPSKGGLTEETIREIEAAAKLL